MGVVTSRVMTVAFVLLLWGAGASEASAQYGGVGGGRQRATMPGRRPTVSPYVAIAAASSQSVGVSNNGAITGGAFSALSAVNAYANITRPGMEQQRLQAQQSRLGGQVGRLQSQLRGTKMTAAELASGLLISPTGRAATYGNFSHYYPTKK
jgi:hypothetical protein